MDLHTQKLGITICLSFMLKGICLPVIRYVEHYALAPHQTVLQLVRLLKIQVLNYLP